MENNYINDVLLKQIAKELNIKISQIQAVLNLIEEGATVPFIARYRKEVTGNLDEEEIRAIYQEWDYGQKLAQRKEDVMRLIEEKGKLTDEIRNAITNSLPKEQLRELVYNGEVITLLQDGLNKVLSGETSFEEIMKIVDVDNDIQNY